MANERDLRIRLSAEDAGMLKMFAAARRGAREYAEGLATAEIRTKQWQRALGQVTREQNRNIGQTKKAIDELERELEKAERAEEKRVAALEAATQRRHQAMTQLGTGMLTAGAAMAAGLGLAARAAVQWESSWAGVTKTVGGSARQMGALEGQLRQLAKELPASHQEIAAVAEAAGALGVKRNAIVGFTRTMVDLGETTNLTADQAATALAQISNVMGTSQMDIGRLGATLVDLGNNGASTEAEIVSMAQRIAGAGRTIGLSEADVLALSSSLASVGIEAEAGGSSISTAMIKIADAVAEGGDAVTGFADVAGLSADQFTAAFQSDPAQAINSFVMGLGRVQDSGANVFATLEDLGLGEIRVRDAMLRLANAGDLLGDQIEIGNDAWESNSALVEEAAKRYDTTAARMGIARNQLQDFAITVGEQFLPAIGAAADKAGSWLDVISDAPQPLQDAAGVLGVLSTAVTLASGAFFLGAPKVAEFMTAMTDMGPRGQAIGRALTGVAGILTGPWGLALGAGVIGLGLFIDAKARAAQVTREFARAVEMDSGAIGENTRLLVVKKLQEEGMLQLARDLGYNLQTVTDAVLGEGQAYDQVTGALNAHIEAVWAEEAAGKISFETAKVRTQASEKLLAAIKGQNKSIQDGVAAHRDQVAAMGDATGATSNAVEPTSMLADATGKVAETSNAAALETGALAQAIKDLTDIQISGAKAAISWEESIDRAAEALARNGRTLNIHSKEGRENKSALIAMAEAARDDISAFADLGNSSEAVAKRHEGHRKKLVQVAEKMGLSKKEARNLIKALYDIPPEVKNRINVNANGSWDWKSDPAALRNHIRQGGKTFKDGGRVRGPGTTTSDSIPALLSDEEYVVNAKSHRRYGTAMLDAINEQRYKDGGAVRRLAKGGAVNSSRDLVADGMDFMNRHAAEKAAAATVTAMKRIMTQRGMVALRYAMAQLGEPYVWGATGPNSWDCSGLTQKAWGAAGVYIPRVTQDQINIGKAVPKSLVQAGDLVFPSTGHVAMAVDRSTLINAPQTGDVVRFRSMYGSPLAIRRPGFAGGGRPPVGQWAWVGERGPELVKFGGPAKVYSNEDSRRMAPFTGPVRGFADGGAVDVPLGEFLSDWRENFRTSSDVREARENRTEQLEQLRAAEKRLREERKQHDRKGIAKAEAQIRKERQDLAKATRTLTDVERRYALSRQPAAKQFGSALALGVRNTGQFLSNLNKLADRGFGKLARHLLELGGEDAEKIAASAVKLSDKNLRGLETGLGVAEGQQRLLEQMPHLLQVRSALKQGKTKFADIVTLTGLAPGDLAAAIKLIANDLKKTSNGRALLADVKAQGFAHGAVLPAAAGIRIWNEKQAGGEAYIPLGAGHRPRSVNLLAEVDRRMGHPLGRRYMDAAAPMVVAAARGGDGASSPTIVNINHVPGYSTPEDVLRATRQAELTRRYGRRR